MTVDLCTASVENTHEVAAAIARRAEPGDLILLCGDLGAGKTAFAQGFGAALGIEEPITSPTFTLANRYDGRLRLNHLDVYRLEHLAEVLDLDLPELIDDDAVTLIEWGDAIAPALSNDYLVVRLAFTTEGPDSRTIEIMANGDRWLDRWHHLSEDTKAWASC